MPLDPVTTEVVVSRLREVAAVMEHALYHSGYSPILRESRDGTAGLTDAQGRVLIVGGGIQYHSLPYQQAVACVLDRFGVIACAKAIVSSSTIPISAAIRMCPTWSR
jgi:N-methylhydantoinase B